MRSTAASQRLLAIAALVLPLVVAAQDTPRERLRAARARSGRALLAGDVGLTVGVGEARDALQALAAEVSARPGWHLVAVFDRRHPDGEALARTLCPTGMSWIVGGARRTCTAEPTLAARWRAEAERWRQAPWLGPPPLVHLVPHHTGLPAVELLLRAPDALALSDLLDRVLVTGSPFVYAAQARVQRPWLAHFERLLSHEVPAFCPADDVVRRWVRQTRFARSLGRRHSYMRVAEYQNKRRWEQELERIGRYLSLHAGRPVGFHETVLCVAHLEAERPWALFDAGLLLDIEVYEAQAVQRDPLGVLSTPALVARQRLLAVAFARVLDGLLLQVPGPRPETDAVALVDGALGQPLPALHAALLTLESLGEDAATRAALRRDVELLQPRRPDQPLFPLLLVERATPALAGKAAGLYCDLSAGDCASAPGRASDDGFMGAPLSQPLPDRIAREGARDELLLLGGYAANRFYALYDLAPALIDGGQLDVVAPLLFWGALLHFALQRADLASLAAGGPHISVDAGAAVRVDPPLLKTYHYWSAALSACALAENGVEREPALRAATAMGRHYRRWMTPLYLSYQVFHEGALGLVASDSEALVALHRSGAAMGYRSCHGVRTRDPLVPVDPPGAGASRR